MDYNISKTKVTLVFAIGMLGALLMALGDWIMIYGETSFEGSLAWLTAGAAEISPERNSFAMILAIPAILCYSVGLFSIRYFIREQFEQRVYSVLTAIGLLPWLCLHFFYVIILFVFGWLHTKGHEVLALEVGEAMFGQFSWLVINLRRKPTCLHVG